MGVINKAVDLALVFLIGGALIVPFAITFLAANWSGAGISTTIASAVVVILIIVFLFNQVKRK